MYCWELGNFTSCWESSVQWIAATRFLYRATVEHNAVVLAGRDDVRLRAASGWRCAVACNCAVWLGGWDTVRRDRISIAPRQARGTVTAQHLEPFNYATRRAQLKSYIASGKINREIGLP